MYRVKSIGQIEANENQNVIQINRKYHKALKHLDEFGNAHVFFLVDKDDKLVIRRAVVNIQEVNEKQGLVIISPVREIIKTAELIDIKPYFPSEDTIQFPVYSSGNMDDCIEVASTEENQEYNINSIGLIRNVNGELYIQLNKMINVIGTYITIFWWFHKFDTEQYRNVTECTPPYENAPRTGIFATRSPVRPNPIAMTVARIIKVDQEKNRIYINNIESYDKTPCIGISEYDSAKHSVHYCRVPQWLAHWPKHIDDSILNLKENNVKMTDSSLQQLLHDSKDIDVSKLTKEKLEQDQKESKLDAEKLKQHTEKWKHSEILVHGARENNLKGINITIPYGKITAVVGVSGSGKSSLVNQTIFAECRRRMEYISNSHSILQKPQVDEILGCIPAIVINQEALRGNALSTVGTYTDAYDCLRNIYANISIRHCPHCGNEIIPLSKDKILGVLRKHKNFGIQNLSGQKIKEDSLENMVEIALTEGEGAFFVEFSHEEKILFQTKQKCYHCNRITFEMTPSTFSYIDTDSRCPVCNGTGKTVVIDESTIIEHPELSLLDGASSFYGKLRTYKNNPNANWMKGQVFGLAESMNVDLEKSWNDLPIMYKEALLHGTTQKVTFRYHNKKNGRKGEITRPVEGIYSIIERIKEENPTANVLDKYMKKVICNSCHGERLNKEGRFATINQIRYPEAAKMTFYDIAEFCKNLTTTLSCEEYEKIEYSKNALLETARTAIQMGIGYLQLSQETSTLSGGEGQRLKLLRAFRNHISGILYIFDEPSKGLHPKDYKKIIEFLQALKEEGNTIIIVEHNEDMIRIADNIIEIGPGPGEKGGYLVGEGTYEAMINHRGTQISKYLNPKLLNTKPIPKTKRIFSNTIFIQMNNLKYNNLKNISIQIPLNALTCICGVSGSGKSTLLKHEIYMRSQVNDAFSEVVLVDQLPIGKTSKSIIATYIGVMDNIRSTFATTPCAVENGWDESFFSFNNPFGQCDTCKGEGRIKVKFSDGAFIQCPDCKGKRYKRKILSALYEEMNIDEILNMSIDQAMQFWHFNKDVTKILTALKKVGLGYLKLGQGTATLSGGEASRLKLAKELITRKNGNILFLLDEPTTGLHFSDIENLMTLINELITSGNTVIAIEHNKQFLEYSDWMIELGPGAGKEGGYLVRESEL